MTDPTRNELTELIERSSLGTPGAVAMRARTDDDTATRIVARSKEFGEWLAEANAAAEDEVADRVNTAAELRKFNERAGRVAQ